MAWGSKIRSLKCHKASAKLNISIDGSNNGRGFGVFGGVGPKKNFTKPET